jgi:hypothetical protein
MTKPTTPIDDKKQPVDDKKQSVVTDEDDYDDENEIIDNLIVIKQWVKK